MLFYRRYWITSVTCSSVARFFHGKGSTLERNYKKSLSYFEKRVQKGHATDWVLFAGNINVYHSIDETMIGDSVYTILSNEDSHGKKGPLVAVVKAIKADAV